MSKESGLMERAQAFLYSMEPSEQLVLALARFAKQESLLAVLDERERCVQIAKNWKRSETLEFCCDAAQDMCANSIASEMGRIL